MRDSVIVTAGGVPAKAETIEKAYIPPDDRVLDWISFR